MAEKFWEILSCLRWLLAGLVGLILLAPLLGLVFARPHSVKKKLFRVLKRRMVPSRCFPADLLLFLPEFGEQALLFWRQALELGAGFGSNHHWLCVLG